MGLEQIIGLLLALAVMGVAILGCLLPGVPGAPLALAAAVAHKLYFAEDSVRWWVLLLLVTLTGMAMAMDYLATLVGAKKMGASRWGMFGALAGLCVGVGVGFLLGGVGSLLGLLIGPLLGATFLEAVTGRRAREAWRAGVGATLGLLAGALGKAVITTLMAIIFAVEVILQSL